TPPISSSNRNFWKYIGIGLSIVSFCIAIGVLGYVYVLSKNSSAPAQKACTLEAKICPDGRSVGRSGPNCEFSQCPTAIPTPTVVPTANWKSFNSPTGRFSIKYPAEWTEVHLGHLDDSSGYEEYASFGPGVRSVTEDSNSKLAITVTNVNKSTSPYKTVREYMSAQEESLKNAPDLVSNALENINIDGASGLKLATAYKSFAGNEIYSFDKNGLLYVFTGTKADSLNQILSTFKFTQ
ncbi:MAG: PsbP-related protein, partial [Candidatus Levyibacteriota bacterium]